jgi:DNA-directed RNA polymerase
MIHGANLYGYDKAAFAERIDWVEERSDLILSTAVDPFADLWWTEADKPWCFLAWCIEYARYLHEGDGFVSSSAYRGGRLVQRAAALLRDAA